MSPDRLKIIALGGLAMFVCMVLRKKQFPQVAIWKMVILDLWLTITGVLGTMVLGYIETGNIGATSFYGAIFLVPILIMPALLLRIPYRDILNLCAPAECAMLIVMRFDCLEEGCCFGRYLPALGFQFPSQISEMVVGAAIIVILVIMQQRNGKASLYPWYMILYGCCRFFLQGFRYGGTEPWVLGLSQGHFWSIIAVIVGIVWLTVNRQIVKKRLSS